MTIEIGPKLFCAVKESVELYVFLVLAYGTTTDSTVHWLCKAINDLCRGSVRDSFVFVSSFPFFVFGSLPSVCQLAKLLMKQRRRKLTAQLVSVSWLKWNASARKTYQRLLSLCRGIVMTSLFLFVLTHSCHTCTASSNYRVKWYESDISWNLKLTMKLFWLPE